VCSTDHITTAANTMILAKVQRAFSNDTWARGSSRGIDRHNGCQRCSSGHRISNTEIGVDRLCPATARGNSDRQALAGGCWATVHAVEILDIDCTGGTRRVSNGQVLTEPLANVSLSEVPRRVDRT